MFKRPTTGSIVCPNCGRLVGVRDDKCLGCGRTNPGLWGFAPVLQKLGRNFGFSDVVIWGCGLLYLVTLVYDLQAALQFHSILRIFSPANEPVFLFGASGAAPIFGYDRWWTVLSAAWLHGGIIHIGFNLMWIRQLAPAVEELYGVGRLMILYVVSSITGFLLTSILGYLCLTGTLAFLPRFLWGAHTTLGASASLCGLFGALLFYGQRTGNRQMVKEVQRFAIYVLVFGLLFEGIDNWAHIGGFLGGYVAAKFLDPLKQESPRHLLIGLVGLAAMLVAIVVSVLHGLPILRAL